MADLNKIVEDLSSLSVVEAAELSKLLEDKWGVSAAAPVAVAGGRDFWGGAGDWVLIGPIARPPLDLPICLAMSIMSTATVLRTNSSAATCRAAAGAPSELSCCT